MKMKTDIMARRLALTLLALIMTTTMAWAQFSGKGTPEDPYLINDSTDWAAFTQNINDGINADACYKLTNDIRLGTPNSPINTIVGKDKDHKFKGTLDGDLHTLHINMFRRGANYAAIFGVTSGATIKNLTVDGEINTDRKYAAGFISWSDNTDGIATRLENCISSVHIRIDTIVTVDNKKPFDCSHSGFVAQVEKGNTEFENCIFDGWIKDFSKSQKANKCTGFVAWVQDGKAIYKNCIMAGEIDVLANGSKVGNTVLTNSMATFHRLKAANCASMDTNTYYINDYTYTGLAEQGRSALNDIPVNSITRQFISSEGDYKYITGAKLENDAITFYGRVYTTGVKTPCQGNDGIHYVSEESNGKEVVFTERYELEAPGDWNENNNWKYNLIPTVGSEVTLKAAVTIPDGCVANVKNIAMSAKASIDVAAGAQFLCLNSVQATIHKTIVEATAKDHVWNTIASPVNKLEFAEVDNLIPTGNEAKHNIYRYDETKPEWEEYRDPANLFDYFENGRGYLYRTTSGGDMSLEGMTNENVEVSLTCSEIKGEKYGINFIGNPYPHNIYKGVAFPNTNLKNGYCVLSADGEWHFTADTVAIPSCTSVMIQATDNLDLVIKNTADAPTFSKSNDIDNIWFTVKNSTYTDKACVNFKEGEGFTKIQHVNENAPMLYINHDGRNYASANVSENTQSISLCFKSKNIGMNTLSVKANGNYSYLHLIDKLTGEDVDLLVDDEYTFVSSDKDNADRFIVRLSYKDNSVEDNEVFAWQNGNDIIVNGNGELQVFDITGRMVMSTMVNGVQTVNVPSQNAYIFRMIGEDVKTQKIVVR